MSLRTSFDILIFNRLKYTNFYFLVNNYFYK